jgi:hypothetical protein
LATLTPTLGPADVCQVSQPTDRATSAWSGAERAAPPVIDLADVGRVVNGLMLSPEGRVPGGPFVDPRRPEMPFGRLGRVLHLVLSSRRAMVLLGALLTLPMALGVSFDISVNVTDETGWGWLLLAVPLAPVVWRVVVLAIEVVRTCRRYAVLRDVEARLGLTWYLLAPGLAKRWTRAPFGGTGARVTEVLAGGSDGRPAVSLRYRAVRSRRRSGTKALRVVAVGLPGPLPWMTLTRETLADRVRVGLGGQDVELESIAVNERWRIRAEDPRAAHAVLNPRLMELLLAPELDDVGLVVQGSDLVLWAPEPADLDRIEVWLGVLDAVAARIPGYLWPGLGPAAPPAGGQAGVSAPWAPPLTGEPRAPTVWRA